MAVHLDVRGSRYHDAAGNSGYDRRAYVDQLTAVTPPGIIAEVLQHPDMPKPGDGIAELPGIVVHERHIEQVGCRQSDGRKWATLNIIYRAPDPIFLAPDDNGPGVLTVGATTEQVTTYKDRNGDQISVEHQGITQGVGVVIKVAVPLFEFLRIEKNNPKFRAEAHVGRVNATPFNGHPARTMFLADCIGTTSNGGESYEVRYRFEKRAGTQDPTVAWIDPDTGDVPPGLVDGTGIKQVEVYDESEFNLLNISF